MFPDRPFAASFLYSTPRLFHLAIPDRRAATEIHHVKLTALFMNVALPCEPRLINVARAVAIPRIGSGIQRGCRQMKEGNSDALIGFEQVFPESGRFVI
jgi:hypothetical protein